MANKKSTASRRKESPIEATARERLGFSSLRSGQKEAVEALLAGHDVLVVQPTGSGKSAIYQIAGLLIDGSTVVISPLIALQKDQVDSIAQTNGAEAAVINSLERVPEIRERFERLESGDLEYIFLAPEQLGKEETLGRLRNSEISLFVVDEAHCISEWGHDFRPAYLRLGEVIEELGHPRVLALTATAAAPVREEIVSRLRMRRPKIFVRGFDRPNIFLRVDPFETEALKRDALVHRVRWADKPGIVYTSTRKEAEEIMQALAAEGIEAAFYHGGLARKQRDAVQERFMSGEAEVIVATNAFGMGIDKPDIRFVYHYGPSDSLDAYYQEIGRAGRDGQKAEAVLFYRRQNIGSQMFKAGEGKLDPEFLMRLATRIAQSPISRDALAREMSISPRKLTAALQRLADGGAIETRANGDLRISRGTEINEAAHAAAEEQERRRASKRERLQKMRAYAETAACRRELLLRYLGDQFMGPCNACDNCQAGAYGELVAGQAAGTRREVV